MQAPIRGPTERSGEVFLLDILSHRTSDMALTLINGKSKRFSLSSLVDNALISNSYFRIACVLGIFCSSRMRRTISSNVLLFSLLVVAAPTLAQAQAQPSAPAQYFFVLLNRPAN